MRCLAAASSALRPVLAGPPQPAECLGVTRGAIYLRTSGPPGVLAILCQDAVRLPCGLTLPATSAELPLTALVPAATSFLVGDHTVRWTGPLGPVDVLCTHIPPAVPELLYDVRARRMATGSAALLDVIRQTQPRYALFGHVHNPLARRVRVGRTECVNVGHFRATRVPYVVEL